MAWTIDDYNALKAAIATGAKKVKYSDKEVEYRDLKEMYSIASSMEAELGIGKRTRYYAQHSRGFNPNC